MTPAYMNPPPSPFPIDQFNGCQHPKLQLNLNSQVSYSASSSSPSYPILCDSTQDQRGCNYMELYQQEADKPVLHGGLHHHNPLSNQIESNSVKWMSSKMRLMKKMQINVPKPEKTIVPKFEDQTQISSPSETERTSNNSSPNNSNISVRVCSDCNTTKTPLWRSGPRGPKSLCNACGIRQRKARRAMAAAAAAAAEVANGTPPASDVPTMKSKSQQKIKDKRSSKDYVSQFKKRCKFENPSLGRKKLCFEEFTLSLSKNSAFHRVFPEDERDAAVLLMALSCGLVHG